MDGYFCDKCGIACHIPSGGIPKISLQEGRSARTYQLCLKCYSEYTKAFSIARKDQDRRKREISIKFSEEAVKKVERETGDYYPCSECGAIAHDQCIGHSTACNRESEWCKKHHLV